MMRIPAQDDILAAAERLAPHVRRTPTLEDPWLNRRVGGRILIKAENLQITGSFKIRGAYNRLLQLSSAEREAGVVAWSAGNHGQALAYAGYRLGIPITILMPSDAPASKVSGTKRWGAGIRFYDRVREDREQLGRHLGEEIGAIIVPPYDDADVIAGQGTAGLELIDQAAEAGAQLNHIVVPVGGGGLIAGCGLAARARSCTCQLLSAEPVGYDDMVRSLKTGQCETIDLTHVSIADALLTKIGPGTLELNRSLIAGGFSLSDDQLAKAVAIAFEHLRVVVEPGGAAALAAVLSNPWLFEGQTTGLLLTGGNVDSLRF